MRSLSCAPWSHDVPCALHATPCLARQSVHKPKDQASSVQGWQGHGAANALFLLRTQCPPPLQQVKAAVTKEDKVMVLLDSHHSEIHVMVGVKMCERHMSWRVGRHMR